LLGSDGATKTVIGKADSLILCKRLKALRAIIHDGFD
jgi:hypothetical protein